MKEEVIPSLLVSYLEYRVLLNKYRKNEFVGFDVFCEFWIIGDDFHCHDRPETSDWLTTELNLPTSFTSPGMTLSALQPTFRALNFIFYDGTDILENISNLGFCTFYDFFVLTREKWINWSKVIDNLKAQQMPGRDSKYNLISRELLSFHRWVTTVLRNCSVWKQIKCWLSLKSKSSSLCVSRELHKEYKTYKKGLSMLSR